MTVESVELNTLDVRFEHTRQKDVAAERRLLSSVLDNGIQDPLLVSSSCAPDQRVVLDGFKRYRCAKKLGIANVPIAQIGLDVADGMLALLRRDKPGGLTIIEQAALVCELSERYKLSANEITQRLGYSAAWVSLRLRMFDDMSELVRNKIMSGAFPARAYLYGLRHFTRVKRVTSCEIDTFVAALSSAGLSARQLIKLAHSYFTGDRVVKDLVLEGKPQRVLQLLAHEEPPAQPSGCDALHSGLTAALQAATQNINTIIEAATNLPSNLPFDLRESIDFWVDEIRTCQPHFVKALDTLYDRSRSPQGSTHIT